MQDQRSWWCLQRLPELYWQKLGAGRQDNTTRSATQRKGNIGLRTGPLGPDLGSWNDHL